MFVPQFFVATNRKPKPGLFIPWPSDCPTGDKQHLEGPGCAMLGQLVLTGLTSTDGRTGLSKGSGYLQN